MSVQTKKYFPQEYLFYQYGLHEGPIFRISPFEWHKYLYINPRIQTKKGIYLVAIKVVSTIDVKGNKNSTFFLTIIPKSNGSNERLSFKIQPIKDIKDFEVIESLILNAICTYETLLQKKF
jgi:hypothetical protein